MGADVLDLINAIFFTAFALLMLLASARMLKRIIAYLSRGTSIPLLLWRDILFFVPFTTVLLLILFFRWQEIVPNKQPLWVITSGLSVTGGLAIWVYIEYFKVEQ